MLAGTIMNAGGVATRIFDFCNTLVGDIPGGLGHVNVFCSVIFAGMSAARWRIPAELAPSSSRP